MSKKPSFFREDAFSSEAYLVEKGVRPLALVGDIDAKELEVLKKELVDKCFWHKNITPFIIKEDDGYSFGFARNKHIVETYKYIREARKDGTITEDVFHTILGLMLGYSVDDTEEFLQKHNKFESVYELE